MAAPDVDPDTPDPQDRAEVEDETHLTEDSDEFATLEEAPDVYDSTQTEGDRDGEDTLAADADELDPDALADEQVEDEELEDRPDAYQPEVEWAEAAGDDEADAALADALPPDGVEGLDEIADADSVEGGEDDFTDFQSKRLSEGDLDALGYRRRRR